MTATAEMRETYLIQRLERPVNLGALKDNPFSFGGGLKNGGLSDGAMDLIREIWSFDYMGSAEFEFGAVPKALQKMAQADLDTFALAVPLAEVPKSWRDKSTGTPEGDATVYVIAPAAHRDEITRRINLLARDDHAFRLKEHAAFTSALRPVNEWDSRRCGWLELDNGFLFFTDEDMWRKACALFGVEALA